MSNIVATARNSSSSPVAVRASSFRHEIGPRLPVLPHGVRRGLGLGPVAASIEGRRHSYRVEEEIFADMRQALDVRVQSPTRAQRCTLIKTSRV